MRIEEWLWTRGKDGLTRCVLRILCLCSAEKYPAYLFRIPSRVLYMVTPIVATIAMRCRLRYTIRSVVKCKVRPRRSARLEMT